MLKDFRSMAQGFGAWVIVVLFILAFAIVGMPQLSNYGRKPTVAVGGTKYSIRDVENEFNRLVERERVENNTIMTRDEAISNGLLTRAVSLLAVEGLYREEAKDLGITTTDEMIQSFLGAVDSLKNDRTGKIDSDLLRRIAQSNNMSLTQFKKRVGNDILRNQIDSAIALPAPMPEDTAKKFALRQTEERVVRTAVLDVTSLPEPSEQDLLSYFAAHTEDYIIPEKRAYAYVAIDPEVIRERIKVDESEIEALYASRKAQLGTPEKRSFTVAQFPDPQSAQSAVAAAQAGEALGLAAAAAGAAVTTFDNQTKDELIDTAVANAVFGAPATGLVGPVEGDFGYVVAEVTAITPAVTVSLDDVRDELTQDLIGSDVETAVAELYDELQRAGDRGESLEEAATALDLDVRKIGPVSRTFASEEARAAAGVPPAIQDTAFSMNVGSIFEEVDLPGGISAFVEVEAIDPEQTPQFEDVAARVQADYGEMQKADAVTATIEQFRQLIDSGKSFDEAAKELGTDTVSYTLSIASNNPAIPTPVALSLFELPIGEVAAGPGNEPATAFVAQTETVRFTPNAQLDRVAATYRQQLTESLGEELYDVYLTAGQVSFGTEQNSAEIAASFGIEP
ncbi:MAG: peptidyl-prolyl cis-trans isomerase [Parvularcula sp.]